MITCLCFFFFFLLITIALIWTERSLTSVLFPVFCSFYTCCFFSYAVARLLFLQLRSTIKPPRCRGPQMVSAPRGFFINKKKTIKTRPVWKSGCSVPCSLICHLNVTETVSVQQLIFLYTLGEKGIIKAVLSSAVRCVLCSYQIADGNIYLCPYKPSFQPRKLESAKIWIWKKYLQSWLCLNGAAVFMEGFPGFFYHLHCTILFSC